MTAMKRTIKKKYGSGVLKTDKIFAQNVYNVGDELYNPIDLQYKNESLSCF